MHGCSAMHARVELGRHSYRRTGLLPSECNEQCLLPKGQVG